MPFVYLLSRDDVNYIGTTNTGLSGIKAILKNYSGVVRKWETNNCPEGEKKIWYDLFKGGIKPQYKILSECAMNILKEEKEKWEAVYYKKNVEAPVSNESVPVPVTVPVPVPVPVNNIDKCLELNPNIGKYLITKPESPKVEEPEVEEPKPLTKDDAKNLRLKEAVNCLRNYYHKKYNDVGTSEIKAAEPVPEPEPTSKISNKVKGRVVELELENTQLKEEVEALKTQINVLLYKLYRSNMLSLNF